MNPETPNLLHPAVISVTGEDAHSYLQSQFSNNLKRTEAKPITYGLFLDRKGKVQADAFILQLDPEAFLLVSYDFDAEALQCKVEENIIADEVELENVSDQYCLVTITGDEQALANLQPAEGEFCQRGEAYIFRGRRTGEANVDCLIPSNGELSFTEQNCVTPDEAELLASRIRSGMPAIPQDIGANDLPHEGGDLSVCAVSYTKGCYLGQEVMARLHAMGRPQRSLYAVNFASQSESGAIPVFAGEKEIGAVTSHIDGNGIALLKSRYVGGEQELCIAKSGGEPLKIIREITA